MEIRQLTDSTEKQAVTRLILEALPEWFGIPEAREEYIRRQLFRQAREAAAGAGYAFMQVKTVQMGKYEEYDRTNRFYLALGFREFEVFPTLWGEENPCQVYIMSLE